MKSVDWVVHFAAESHVDRSIVGPKVFIKTNIIGTQVLLDTALKYKVKKFHHVSTDEVFGELPLKSKEKFSEDTLYDPRSPYSASKAASDHLVRAYHHTYGLPITITNTSNNYGPYQDPEKFLPRMITNLIDGKKLPIYGDGKYVRDWLYVDDHVRAIELVLQKGVNGETYLVGGQTKDVNNLEIAMSLLKIFRKDKGYIKFVKDRAGHDRRYAINWNKINKELEWKPKYDFNDWLKKTVLWYKVNEWWWRPLKKKAEILYNITGQK
jgi:dTDP-glucose 4,6-dehydratase